MQKEIADRAGSYYKGQRYPALVRLSPYVWCSVLSRWAMKSILYRWKPILMQRSIERSNLRSAGVAHTKVKASELSRTEKEFLRVAAGKIQCVHQKEIPALVRSTLLTILGSSVLSRWAMKSILYRSNPAESAESLSTPKKQVELSRTEKRNFYRWQAKFNVCIERIPALVRVYSPHHTVGVTLGECRVGFPKSERKVDSESNPAESAGVGFPHQK
ncbi:hypothetical protein NPIL_16521 [Nephila pilipes]|uniref:Uncharacterized protein n=1 Tax=Nephila pilipes TaxID=299642 RepID=A0A8X6MUU2_NEPPI|nr:hypothetical protein NPIL_16521 [Nephila pilipes]